MSRRGRISIAVIGAALLLLIFVNQIVDIWTDWLWFHQIGYASVFSGVLKTKIWLFVLFFLLGAAIIAGNLYLAFRLRPPVRYTTPDQQALERYRVLLTPRVRLWVIGTGVIIGLFSGLAGQAHWQQWMLLLNGGPFGVTDPQFGIDVGFYVFDFPFWRYLLDFAFSMTVLALIGALAVHYIYGGLRLQGPGDRLSGGTRIHLSALVTLFVVFKAIAYFLDRRALLIENNSSTDLTGAGYSGINAILPAKEILAYISIVVAVGVLVFSTTRFRNLLWAGASLALLGLSAVVIGGIYPWAVQQFSVRPNIPVKEADYIARTIDFTRQAYGLQDVTRTQYSATTEVPPTSLSTDTSIVPAVRLLDPAVVNDTFAQYQQIRSFYDFQEKLDVDRYTINGKLQDFVVGVREINYNKLEGQQNNWQNRHSIFTHGYGFVAAPANTVCDGAPFFVSGLIRTAAASGDGGEPAGDGNATKCVAADETIPVDQPRIYYGELAGYGDYIVVGKADGAPDSEFDRPAGEGEDHFAYTGEGGVPVASLWRRMLYSMHFHDFNFLLSNVFNDNSKLIYVRNPRERVERVAPFLTLDGDPYPAVINGRVMWILDGYTTSSTYPYSQRVDLRDAVSDTQSGQGTVLQARQDINYIRNSVKATVDAYDGTVTLYQFDETDPILAAWNKAFGGNLIKPRSEIPAELAAHLRYPEDLFKVQRDLLSKFHVDDPKAFNTGQDFWEVPADPAVDTGNGNTDAPNQPPYYLLTQFPGSESQRFQLTAALTPVDRQNLSALVAGVLAEDNQPRLEVLELPRDTRIPGPGQAKQLMANDTAARSQITLLDGGGEQAQVVYANLLSLPFGNGLLYVQPIYLKSKDVADAYPLMRLVLVSYGNQVGFGESLSAAIANLLEKSASSGDQTTPPDTDQTQPPPTTEAPPTTQPPPTTGPGEAPVTLTPELAAALERVDAAITAVNSVAPGDFAAYGTAMQELDAALAEYESALAAARPQSTAQP